MLLYSYMHIYIHIYIYTYIYIHTHIYVHIYMGLPRWHSSGESACNAGDTGDADSTPVSGRYPGGGNGNSHQYSYLENPIVRGAW